MKKYSKHNSLFEKELSKPSFHEKFERRYPLFQLEVQLLNELEKHHLTYMEFASRLGTKKGNISRDLKQGGIHHATLDRMKKIADTLNCVFIPLIIPKEKEDKILSRIENILTHV